MRLWSVVIMCTRKYGVGKELSCMKEVENFRDLFVVAVVRSCVIISDVPRKLHRQRATHRWIRKIGRITRRLEIV